MDAIHRNHLPRSCQKAALGGNVGRGWWPLLNELEDRLDQLSPDWRADQVKEKFGQLRFYAQPNPNTAEEDKREFYEAIRQTENASAEICEECGQAGRLARSPHGWIRTLCEGCAKSDQFSFLAPLDESRVQATE